MLVALSSLLTACPFNDSYFIETEPADSAGGAGGASVGPMGAGDHAGRANPAGAGMGGAPGMGGGPGMGGSVGVGGSAGAGGGAADGGNAGPGMGGVRTDSGPGGMRMPPMTPPDVDAATRDGSTSDVGAIGPNASDAGSIFSDDFERDTIGMPAVGWTRVGGSSGDWKVVTDVSRVFAQAGSGSTTLRVCYAGPETANAASVSARTKITADGSSGTTTAMICIRYVAASGDYQCLALEPGIGLQIKTSQGNGPIWQTGVSLNLWYRLKLGIDASGLLSGYLDGNLLGTFRPPMLIGSGFAAISTQSSEAEFDDVLVTSP